MALNKPGAHNVHVGRGKLQLQPSLLVAHRNGDLGEVVLKVRFLISLCVPRQVQGCSLFRLGPETFACHIGSRPVQNLGAQKPSVNTQTTIATNTQTMTSNLLAIGRRRSISGFTCA